MGAQLVCHSSSCTGLSDGSERYELKVRSLLGKCPAINQSTDLLAVFACETCKTAKRVLLDRRARRFHAPCSKHTKANTRMNIGLDRIELVDYACLVFDA